MRYLYNLLACRFLLSTPTFAVSSEEEVEEYNEYDEAESLVEDAADEDEEQIEEQIEFEVDDDEEAVASEDEIFKRLDFNKDGMLSAPEIFAHDESIGTREAEKVAKMASKYLLELPEIDKNADALISPDELPSLLEWIQKKDNEAVFNDLDTDKDGRLTAEEIFATQEKNDPDLAAKIERHYYEHLPNIDKDGDAMISPAELPALLEASYDYERESRKVVTDTEEKEEEPGDATAHEEVEDSEEHHDEEEDENSDEDDAMS